MKLLKSSILCLIVVYCTLAAICSSCRKDDTYDMNARNIPGIWGHLLVGYEKHYQSGYVNGIAAFQYQNNRVVKREGAQIPISTGTSSSTIGIDGIYDTVEYAGLNTIIITQKDTITGLDVPINKRVIYTDNTGLIVEKITYADQLQRNDTIYYKYDSQKKLAQCEQYFSAEKIVREFAYDNNSNLQTITRTFIDRYTNASYQDTEVFGGYDNKINPLRGQCLWPDILYRTLSKNNFTTYFNIRKNCLNPNYGCYADTPTLKTWSLQYDSRGNLIIF